MEGILYLNKKLNLLTICSNNLYVEMQNVLQLFTHILFENINIEKIISKNHLDKVGF